MSTANSFDFFTNVFGFIVGVVSLSAFLAKVFLYHLPSRKIKKLESLIDQTEKILQEGVEKGLLAEPALVEQLSELKIMTSQLRCRVSHANTPCQNCLGFQRDTSASIGDVHQSLEELKARLKMLSEEQRTKENTHEISLAYPPPALLHNPSLEHDPWPFPSPPISRPSSLSFEIQERGFPRIRRARKGLIKTSLWRWLLRSVCTDPSCDRAKSDSDVREADTQMNVSTSHTSVTAEDGA